MYSWSDYRLVVPHLLNFLDAVLTLRATSLGAIELNPIMAWAIEQSPFLFLLIKLFAFSFLVEFLHRKLVGTRRRVFTFLLAVFSLVVAWHIYGVFVMETSCGQCELTDEVVCEGSP